MSMIGNPLQSLFGGADKDADLKRIPVIRKEPRILILGDAVYQITNISVVKALDLSTVKGFPKWYLLIALIGVYLIIYREVMWGILALGLFALLYYLWDQNKLREAYGVRIVTNSGEGVTIVSNNLAFVRLVRDDLAKQINSQSMDTVVYDFSNSTRNTVSVGGDNNAPITIGNRNKVESTVTKTGGGEKSL